MPEAHEQALEQAMSEFTNSRVWSPYGPVDGGELLKVQARFGGRLPGPVKQMWAVAGGGEFSVAGHLVVFFDTAAALDALSKLKGPMPGWFAFADDSLGTWFMVETRDPEAAVYAIDCRQLESQGQRRITASFADFLTGLARGTLER